MQEIWKQVHNAGEEPSYKQAGLSNSSSYSGQLAFQKRYNKQFKMLLWREKERTRKRFTVLEGYCSRQ